MIESEGIGEGFVAIKTIIPIGLSLRKKRTLIMGLTLDFHAIGFLLAKEKFDASARIYPKICLAWALETGIDKYVCQQIDEPNASKI